MEIKKQKIKGNKMRPIKNATHNVTQPHHLIILVGIILQEFFLIEFVMGWSGAGIKKHCIAGDGIAREIHIILKGELLE